MTNATTTALPNSTPPRKPEAVMREDRGSLQQVLRERDPAYFGERPSAWWRYRQSRKQAR